MDKKTLSLEIEKFSILADQESNSQLAIVEIYVCHDGNNLHNVPISNLALRKAKDTLKNKFLVAGFDGKDFEGHEVDEQIIGFFPESSKMRFEKRDDRTYLVAQAIMSKVYAKWAYDVFVESNNKRAVSMEITVLKGKVDKADNLLTIEEFVFNGVTVLGLSHVPACEGSSASIIKFDTENALRVYNKHCKEATDLKKRYVDNMVKFSGKEEVGNMDEKELKVEDTVVEEVNTEEVTEVETEVTPVEEAGDQVVECEIKKEDADQTMYTEPEEEKEDDKDDDDKDDEDKEEDDKEEVENEVKCEAEGEVAESGDTDESLPTENCETEEIAETEEPEGEVVETLESVVAERNSLKEENETLKSKIEKYEAQEKAENVESIISTVLDVFSADEISELREEAEKYSLDELNIFANEVKAKAFDAVKGKTSSKKSFTKVAINDVLDKPESKYTW